MGSTTGGGVVRIDGGHAILPILTVYGSMLILYELKGRKASIQQRAWREGCGDRFWRAGFAPGMRGVDRGGLLPRRARTPALGGKLKLELRAAGRPRYGAS
jgi:hypothetical protein